MATRTPLARTGRLAGYAVLTAIAVSVIYPFLYTLNVAVKSPVEFAKDNFGVARHPTFANLTSLWEQTDVLVGLRNSLVIAAGAVLILWATGSMAAFAVAKLRFRGRVAFFLLILSSSLVPFQAIVASLYVELLHLRMLDSYLGVILVFVSGALPVTTFLFAGYLRGLPNSVIEAARMDGASTPRIIWHVVLPMSRPVLAVTGMLNFVLIFNDLLTPLIVLQSPEKQPFVVKLAVTFGHIIEPTEQAAAVVLGLAPLILVFLFAQRFLLSAATAGAER